MKYLLILIIKLYWATIPTSKRKKCIFKKSCSHFVHEQTTQFGFVQGLNALKYRLQNCRKGAELFYDPIDGKACLLLVNGDILKASEIADSVKFQ